MSISRLHIAGTIFVFTGILSLPPLLGRHLLADGSIEYSATILAVIVSLLIVTAGLTMIFWNTRIELPKILGKETWIRLLLVSFPFLLLVMFEVALIAADHRNPPTDADDLRARKLMKASWGTAPQDGLLLFSPSQNPIFKINKTGFRTHELDTHKEGETRIMLLGGSTAFGWGVADHHGIDKSLEQILSARTGSQVKVFNLSIPAIEFPREIKVLEKFAAQVSPDVVVFYHGANDGLAWYQQTIGRKGSRQSLTPPLFSISTLIHLAYRSRVFRLVSEAIRTQSEPKQASEIDVSAAIKDYETHLADSASHCASIRCAYIIQPIIFDKAARTTREIKISKEATLLFPLYEQMYEKYADTIMSKSFADHFDARTALSKSDEDMFLDYVHVTGAGNRLLAHFIADTLCKGDFVHCD